MKALIRNPLLAVAIVGVGAGHPVSAALTSPVPAFQQTGTYGIAVAADGPGANQSVSGVLNLPPIPATANVVKAYLYAGDTNHPGTISGTLNGAPLPIAGAYASDAAFNTLYTFRWDVTSSVPLGLPSLTYSLTEQPDMFAQQGLQIGLVALAIVYSDASLGQSVATIVDGMTYVGNPHGETETININGLPVGTGTSTISTVTYLDDNIIAPPANNSGEVVRFNGSIIGGPLDKNLTLNGSLNTWTGTTVAGVDSMSISTNDDEFGWMLTTVLTPVPEPTPLILLMVAAFFLCRRHRTA